MKKTLNLQDKKEIIQKLNAGITQHTLAKEYKVSQPRIAQIMALLRQYIIFKERIKQLTKVLTEAYMFVDRFEDTYGDDILD